MPFLSVSTPTPTPTTGPVVDQLGGHLGDREFPADPTGYHSLLDWISSIGSVTGVGVEGTGTYGAHWAEF